MFQCWKYMRRKAKKYNAEKKQEKKKTGNVQDKPFINNLKYEKVLQITGTSHGCGLELGEEDGFPIVKAEQIEEVDDTVAHVKGKRLFSFICCPHFSIFFLQNSVFLVVDCYILTAQKMKF